MVERTLPSVRTINCFDLRHNTYPVFGDFSRGILETVISASETFRPFSTLHPQHLSEFRRLFGRRTEPGYAASGGANVRLSDARGGRWSGVDLLDSQRSLLGIKEVIASVLSLRSRTLEVAIRNMLQDADGDVVEKILGHPMIAGTTAPGKKLPSYISVRNFAYGCAPAPAA